MKLLSPTKSFTKKTKELELLGAKFAHKKSKHKIGGHLITSALMFLTGLTGIILTDKYYF